MRETGEGVAGSPEPPPSEEVVYVVDDDPHAVGGARRFVSENLARWGLLSLADDAQLIASELLTNALLHAGPPAQVVLRVAPPKARVEVRDSSPLPPMPQRFSNESMTGRGLRLVERLATQWGVAAAPSGKAVWAELEDGHQVSAGEAELDALAAVWAPEEVDMPAPREEQVFTVRLGDVPTDLLLSAKAHVDNLVREFTLAASGASSGATDQVPVHIAELIEGVVNRFSEARLAIKRQAIAAANAGEDHVRLELTLPASAADAAEEYLRALDQADEYCRAARMLTLESPPQHRIFRRWYVEELISQLRRAAAGTSRLPTQTLQQRLLREIDGIAAAERRSDQAARLHTLVVALAAAVTPEAVTNVVLREGVAALGATGGGVLLVGDRPFFAVPGTVGYDDDVVARLRAESPDAQLPAATALRTGEPVWIESRAERDEQFPQLIGFEPSTVSLCAVPLTVGGRRLGALRFSFREAHLFGADERRFVEAMAAHTAHAFDRALLSRQALERSDDAQRLQVRLRPPQLPVIPGVEMSRVAVPVNPSLQIGGDFLDVWQCAPQRWAVALGEVAGTGPDAAALAVFVRHTLRALTLSSADVEQVLLGLNEAMRTSVEDPTGGRFCRAAYGLLTTESDEVRLHLATGGHPRAITVEPDGTTSVIELSGSLLGVLPQPNIDEVRVRLRPGGEIVLVTDGALEARRDDGTVFGLPRVVEAVRAAAASGASTAQAVHQAVLEYTGGRLTDDLAVLGIRWRGR